LAIADRLDMAAAVLPLKCHC